MDGTTLSIDIPIYPVDVWKIRMMLIENPHVYF